MNNQLSEEKLNRLLLALSPIAKHIAAGNMPDQDALKEILFSIGVETKEWAIEEVESWTKILQKTSTVATDDEKAAIAKELQDRGVPEASAILAVEAAIPPPLKVKPQNIDFGCLKPDEGANATLEVTGKLVKVTVHNNRLKVTLLERGSGNSLVKVMLLGGSAGESLQDSVVLRGEKGELRVPVRVQWEKEPPKLQYCPRCRRKSLFWNRYDKKFECLNSDCKEPPRLQTCPVCTERSLFWNHYDKKFECLNLKCQVEGPYLDKDKLVRPQGRRYHGSH